MKTALKSTLATLALGLALGAAMPANAQNNSDNFDVTLTVTAPDLPIITISDLADRPLGTIARADLTSPGPQLESLPFCVVNTGGPASPKVTFRQIGAIFNSDIGNNFALIGPARPDTNSGLAQVPFAIRVTSNLGASTWNVVRDQLSPFPMTTGTECQSGSIVYGPGAGALKPMIGIQRLAASDALNPAGPYIATIEVIVSTD